MRRLLLGASLLLAGCVTTTPLPGPGDATFVDPSSAAVVHCDNPGWTAMFRGGYWAPIRYGWCKDAAEAKGYVRVR